MRCIPDTGFFPNPRSLPPFVPLMASLSWVPDPITSNRWETNYRRVLSLSNSIPVLLGSERVATYQEALDVVDCIGLPVMMKAAAGGGGRGMKVVTDRDEMENAFVAASAEARSAFGDETIYLERFISNARHIEVQVLGDRFGNVIHLGERDCSLQRRHQKIIEEAPAPEITETLRQQIREAAVKLARTMNCESAGTVEFVYDEDAKAFYFLEMNTRIQVSIQ
jgi:acetyl-CoA carboxylase, biotin carboxylase subunit